jgi:hypothetical protein
MMVSCARHDNFRRTIYFLNENLRENCPLNCPKKRAEVLHEQGLEQCFKTSGIECSSQDA